MAVLMRKSGLLLFAHNSPCECAQQKLQLKALKSNSAHLSNAGGGSCFTSHSKTFLA